MPSIRNVIKNRGLAVDLKALTSLRFLAAFWVVLFHLRSRVDEPESFFWSLVENGARGVDFFFILSGFVISHAYGASLENGTFNLRKYLIKRVNRLYPLHLVMLVLFLFLAIISSRFGGSQTSLGHSAGDIAASVFLLHAWKLTDGLVLNGPSWTISAEMFAYILFGICAVFFRMSRILPLVIAALVTFVIIHGLAIALGKSAFMHLTWDFGSLRIIPLFILGMLLRECTNYMSRNMAVIAFVVAIISLVPLIGLPSVDYALILPFGLLISSCARLSGESWFWLNHRVFVYLGEISYSAYMVHVSVLVLYFDLVPKVLPFDPDMFTLATNTGVIIFFVLLASAMGYHLIERPSRNFLNSRLAR